MANVRALEGMIRERVHVLMGRFDEFKESGDVMMMSWAFAAFTNGETCAPLTSNGT